MMSTVFEQLSSEFSGAMALPWPVFVARVLGAVVLTGIVGFERETRDRPAGLRTHMLVGLAAVGYSVATLELLALDHSDDVRMDPLRLVDAVTSGVAFLAAGLIVFARGEVRGLTTGASLWLAAAIGLSIGLGLWLAGGIVTVTALLIVRGLGYLERRLKSQE